MKKKIGSIEDIISYGLDTIEDGKSVNLPLKDFLLVYRTIEELRRFFHNKDHYPDLEIIHKYVGNKNHGMGVILNKIYLDILDKAIDSDIEDLLESKSLYCNLIPFYYNYKEK